MKRLLFTAAILLCIGLSESMAQNQGFISSSTTTIEITEIQQEKKKKVVEVDKGWKNFAELEIGIPIETASNGAGHGESIGSKAFAIGANYIYGYKFNNHILLGGGIGLGYIDAKGWCANFEDYDDLYIKLFINSKIYITRTKIQPFIDLKVGGIYFRQEARDYDGVNKKFGIVLHPSIGVNFNLKNRKAIYATFGGNIMPGYYPEGYLTLNIGYTF